MLALFFRMECKSNFLFEILPGDFITRRILGKIGHFQEQMKYPCIFYAPTEMINHMGIACVSQNVPLHLIILNT